jgi:short subunit dehydrogenase-like uncharacterized protein
MTRPFDLVLYGATGFTGRRTAHALHALGGHFRWAIAGRDPKRVASLAAELGVEGIVADAADGEALAALAKSAKVVVSTAGPFALHSDTLVDACVANDTHWCDITGETAWVRRLIERHHEHATRTGTRIVPLCGFDSIPSDTCIERLEREAQQRFGEALREVEVCWKLKGGLNGGTMASAREIGASGDWKRMGDPLLLSPLTASAPDGPRPSRDPSRPFRSSLDGRWLAPFMMGPVDTRVVRRTRLLAGLDPRTLAHREGHDLGGWAYAWGGALALGALGLLMVSAPGRALLRWLSPAPGDGPTEARIASGSTRATFLGTTTSGRRLLLRLDAEGDAGNAVTVRCLVEAAQLLMEGTGSEPGGVLTPVAAFGPALLKRLEATGAHRVSVEELSTSST